MAAPLTTTRSVARPCARPLSAQLCPLAAAPRIASLLLWQLSVKVVKGRPLALSGITRTCAAPPTRTVGNAGSNWIAGGIGGVTVTSTESRFPCDTAMT